MVVGSDPLDSEDLPPTSISRLTVEVHEGHVLCEVTAKEGFKRQ